MFLNILYALALAAASPYLLYRSVREGKYRDHAAERFGRSPRRAGSAPCVWIHAVSLGEMRATRTLVPALEAAVPGLQVVLSTNTETGRAEAGKLHPGRSVFYYPLDFTGCVAASLDRVRPDCVVLMELEFWPNFSAECRRRGVPVVLVNGRISARSAAGYARAGRVVADMFNRADRLCVQTSTYAERFRRLGAASRRITVVPNLKYDTADFAEPPGTADLAAEIGLAPGDELIVGGSTGPTEEAALLSAYRELRGVHPALRLALVPRHPHRFDAVAALVRGGGFPLLRRSRPTERPDPAAGPPVILGDTMGELKKFYALCRAAFLGRSLIPAGGSDMAEAAALGKPTLFGPHTSNFEDTVECLTAAGAALRVETPDGLTAALGRLLDEPAAAEAMGRRAADAVRAKRGGTAQCVEVIARALRRRRPSLRSDE
jgi:3-deoxy-D-manno-octulosonic-acid transferase